MWGIISVDNGGIVCMLLVVETVPGKQFLGAGNRFAGEGILGLEEGILGLGESMLGLEEGILGLEEGILEHGKPENAVEVEVKQSVVEAT